MSKFEIKLGNFKNALLRLKEAAVEYEKSNSGDVIRDGMIQRFEFTYELAWKTAKEYLESTGITDINSPKAVVKELYSQRLIVNEKTWILMLNDRNMTSHTYKEELADEIAGRLMNYYIKEFELLLGNLQK